MIDTSATYMMLLLGGWWGPSWAVVVHVHTIVRNGSSAEYLPFPDLFATD